MYIYLIFVQSLGRVAYLAKCKDKYCLIPFSVVALVSAGQSQIACYMQ